MISDSISMKHVTSRGSKWFYGDGGTIMKMAHIQLASGVTTFGAVWYAINDQAASTANAFATIMFKSDGQIFTKN